MMRTLLLLLPLAVLTAGCTTPAGPKAVAVVEAPPAEQDWRDAALPADAVLVDALPETWRAARARVTTAAEGELLDPERALDHPALSPGSYNCRAVRLDREGLRAFPPQFCFVRGETDGRLSFNKQTGTDLPNGWLYPDGSMRYVFLGAQQRRAGENSLAYATDRAADRVGVIERIGPFRWRLVMPRTDALWVYELTPVPAEQQP